MGIAWEFVPGTVPGVTLQFIGVWSLFTLKICIWFILQALYALALGNQWKTTQKIGRLCRKQPR